MNLILIHPYEWPDISNSCADITLTDRRFDYIRSIHKPVVGDYLRVGLLHGKLGRGEVLDISGKGVQLRVSLDQVPPSPSQAILVLALPRPNQLRRILQAATTLGTKEIYLIGSQRVEKSYWQTPLLQDESIQEQLMLGLEQAQDTLPPKIYLRQRFKPFLEDELKNLVTNRQAIVAHPKNTDNEFPGRITSPACIAIGPEGGFIPYEIEMFEQIGFQAKHLGERILKVETAVSVALGRCLA